MAKSSLLLLSFALIVCLAAPSDLLADPVEWVIILDGSSSNTVDDWQAAQEWCLEVFNAVPPEALNGDLSVSIVQYGNGALMPRQLAPLNTQADVDTMKTLISDMLQMLGYSHAKTAVETGINEFNQRGAADARRIITLFADGWPTSRDGHETQHPAPLKPALDALGVEVSLMTLGAFEPSRDLQYYEPILDSTDDVYSISSYDGGYHEEIFEHAALPEPATMSLLAIGGAAMLARRKRKND